jgi:mannose-6-phosphate isomerase-like protein (cupin superfamily)
MADQEPSAQSSHPMSDGIILSTHGRTSEAFDNPAHGDAHWFTLFSADRTPTSAMSAGLMVLSPGGRGLEPHRHAQAEIYFIAAGSGVLTVNGIATPVAAGAAAFIPGDAEHSIKNDGQAELRVFYVFPTDSFGEIVYRFSAQIA